MNELTPKIVLSDETINKKEKGRIEIIFFDNQDITFKVTQLNKIEVIGALTVFLEDQKRKAEKDERNN